MWCSGVGGWLGGVGRRIEEGGGGGAGEPRRKRASYRYKRGRRLLTVVVYLIRHYVFRPTFFSYCIVYKLYCVNSKSHDNHRISPSSTHNYGR